MRLGLIISINSESLLYEEKSIISAAADKYPIDKIECDFFLIEIGAYLRDIIIAIVNVHVKNVINVFLSFSNITRKHLKSSVLLLE
jgi:hypothetical protein